MATCGAEACRKKRRRRQYRAAAAGMVERDRDRVERVRRAYLARPEVRERRNAYQAAWRRADHERILERDRDKRRARHENPDAADAARRYQRGYYQSRMTDEQHQRLLERRRQRRAERMSDPAEREKYNAAMREYWRTRRLRELMRLSDDQD